MMRGLSSLAILFALGGCASQAQPDVLEKIVFLSRHGIRSPTLSPQEMQHRTGHTWQAWSVAPGEMTQHGAVALAAMVQVVQRNYSASALFQGSKKCQTMEQETVVWADTGDHRTRQTGDVWAKEIAPGCAIKAQWATTGVDPVFNALGSQAGQIDRGVLEQEFAAATKTLSEPASHNALKAVQSLMAPEACSESNSSPQCFLGATKIEWKKGTSHLQGGFVTGGMAAESLLLTYTEGLSLADFKVADKDAPHVLEAVMPAHEAENHLLRRLPEYARARNGVMGEGIRAFLSGRPVLSIPGISPSTKVLVLAGHDTNLAAMMALFGLDWSFPDQPDSTAPNTVLAFERWRHADGSRDVRIRVFHQSLAELRQGRGPDIETSALTLSPSRPILFSTQ
ncbi:MAG: phosphoanhydride phosphohydrolase [Gluconobacter sp.]|uniref:phosphoanhydride phosphohydrolase n=1 Tax=Gluconobacter sp. TaxID=1876758 RepID=UPI0039ED9739